MANTLQPPPTPDRATLRAVVVSAVLAGLLFLILALVFNVRNLLSSMEQTDLDKGQWVMIQTEVEVLRLHNSLLAGEAGHASEADIRRWFNVLYSRIVLLSESPIYAAFVQQPENAADLRRLRAFADTWASVVDGPDDALTAALPRMQAAAADLQGVARRLSLESLVDFSSATDRARAGLSKALTRLALTTGATMAMLLLLALLLWRASATARARGQENRTTGARLQMIIATSPDAIVVTNRDGWVVEFNPAAEAMFGLSRDEALGKKAMQAIFAPEDHAACQKVISEAIDKAVAIGPQRLELEGVHVDGHRFPLELSIAIRDLARDGLIVAFMRDISATRAADATVQAALRKARAGERAKARFIAVMSHEMRTPLNGLIGSMGLMRDTGLDADQVELLRVMQVSAEALLGHVNAVLDLSVAEAGMVQPLVQPFDLDRVLADCVANQTGVARKRRTRLRQTALTGSFVQVMGDAARVRQVLLNLIGNAVKFTPGGSVTVESERLPPAEGSTVSPWVEVRIIDTGIGIAPKDQARVFQDFETAGGNAGRAFGGTGLGLGIARRLVEAMGGQIGLESDLGAGSVFWVRLPLPSAETGAEAAHSAQAQARTPAPGVPSPARAATGRQPDARPADGPAPARGPSPARSANQPPTRSAAAPKASPDPSPPATAPAATPPAARLSVLIIEDNDINRFLLRRYLETAGHDVTEAVDGLDGVTQADARAFDLIVTDITMPQLDGIEAARRIRDGGGASARARIIVLTAHALPSDQVRIDDAGIDACLTKPVSREVLLHAAARPVTAAVAPPPEGLAPLLDGDRLAEMASALGPARLARLIERKVAEGDSTLSDLDRGDQTAHLLHQLTGGCALFGAAAMRLALTRAETAVRLGHDTEAALASLPPLWRDTRAALVAYAGTSS